MSDSLKLKPFIPDENAPREYTVRSFILATVLTLLFGVAAGYLGLKIGYTFAASIPASVMALAVLRGLLRSDNILEANIVQTQASAGESLMGGVVYMIPALIFLNMSPSVLEICILAAAGGLLGILLMIPFRQNLIVDEHAALPYPEGTACANILKLGAKAAAEARHVLSGMGIGAAYNLLTSDGVKLFSGQINLSFQRLLNLSVGMQLTPLMLGVGFLVGPTVGWEMLGGALLKGVLVVPGLTLAHSMGQGKPLAPEELEFLVRMIGAGAVATGGFLSIGKMLPQMLKSLRSMTSLSASRKGDRPARIDRNLPLWVVAAGLILTLGLAVLALEMSIPAGGEQLGLGFILLSVILIFVLGLLFVNLCARLVGIVGTSSYPLSGMTIGALLVSVSILRFSGLTGPLGMATAIVIGAVICVAIALSADISQDLKTGVLLGATPARQQVAGIVGVLMTSVAAGIVIMLFHESGELAKFPAPQARMMATIVQGVMADQFQWLYVGIGVLIAVAAELLGVSAIMVAVGLYLPIPLASAFILGGAVRGLFDKRQADSPDREILERKGTLLSSGMIAGWAITGVLLVGLVAAREFGIADIDIALRALPEPGFSFGYLFDLALSVLLCGALVLWFGRSLRLWGTNR